MHKPPIIGITLDSACNSEKYRYSSFPWYALRQNYAESVIKAGGSPLMIPYQPKTINRVLDVIDGLIIPGGDEDIHPKFYGQDFTNDRTARNDKRDEFEVALLKKSLEKNIPFLGICRGMQLLNVLCGGDLIQHIPDYMKTNGGANINHEQPPPKHVVSHLIHIEPNTQLAKLANGNHEIMVNSTHHQAIGKVAPNLLISAVAPDGIIEAVESREHKFVIGVEWHPEYLNSNGLDLELFKGLVAACQSI